VACVEEGVIDESGKVMHFTLSKNEAIMKALL
jgi:hypothetical protein